ncbi:MAG: 4'-phosphopantetheinyl transferase family protein [Gammaproteobacteria bacterium]
MIPNLQIMLMDPALQTSAELERDVLPRLHVTEQARYRVFANPNRRQTWLAGRALLLAALARRLGRVDATALCTEPRGGVRYQDDAIHISLSHCRNLIAVALAQTHIGVDVEMPRPRNALRHVEDVFSASEARQLREMSETAQQEAFYILWTLKEAACKAAGISLWESLRGARFDLDALNFSSQPPFPAGDWRFMSACIEPGWRIAAAVRDAGATFEVECWHLDAVEQWRRQELVRPVFLQEKCSAADPALS